MDEKEYNWLTYTILSQYFCFILFPAVCFVFIIFGYHILPVVILEFVLLLLVGIPFILRTIFLVKYPKYNKSKKRFLFETISYCACIAFAIGTGFLVEFDGHVWSYYFLNIYIQPAFIIYTLVVLGFLASTAKRISKIYLTEVKIRKTQGTF